ncbi:YceI family protein [Carboxylicivirga sp. RSCT41]|uniref:YceI family protein n=1 Tax=Carboxylicivirga agarovorans TaxID=3417570 RepID=UPI003D327EAE
MKHIILILSLLVAFSQVKSQTINSDASVVEFSIIKFKWNKVKGTFKGMQGEVSFDKDNLSESHFNVSVDPSTVNTGSKKRDKHLNTEDFFHVEKYKTITFKSKLIRKDGESYIADGSMTMHGVTKDVSIPFTVVTAGDSSTLEGEIEVDRFDYGVGAEKYSGTFMVGQMVKVKIICTLE